MRKKQLLVARGVQILLSNECLNYIENAISEGDLKDNMVIEILLKDKEIELSKGNTIVYKSQDVSLKLKELFNTVSVLYVFIIEEPYFFTLTIYCE